MNVSRSGRIVGALFLLSNVTFLLGAVAFIEPVLGAPDYLTLASESRAQVVLGVLLELTNALAYIGIAVLVYPILRKRFPSLALGYVALRIVEFLMQIATDLSPLSLISVSEAFVEAGAPAASSFQAVGTLLLAERHWAFQGVSMALGLGALLFYTMSHQTRLFPRFIAIWGLVGATVVLVNTVFDMLAVSIPNLGYLMLLNEVFLGVWLIVKGFSASAVVSDAAGTTSS